MKLYTINATPVRSFKQLSENEQGAIKGKYATLASINSANVQTYPEFVAGLLKIYGIDGFTIYQVQGYWEGQAEVSFKIEVAIDDATDLGSGKYVLLKVCANLRDHHNQDSVMLTNPDNTVEFI